MSVLLSKSEKTFIEDGISQNLRVDGRQREDFRTLRIEKGLIPQASGSSRLRLGGTDVLVGVKVEIGAPAKEHPTWGRMHFTVDVAATVSPSYEGRGSEDIAAELTQVMVHCFGGSTTGAGAAVSAPWLGIIPGRTCWVVNVDALVVAADGNLLDAIAAATKVALADTRIPKVEVIPGLAEEEEPDFEVDEDPEASLVLPMDTVPVIITLRQFGRQYFVDASAQEESLAHPALSVAVNGKGEICALLKGGVSGMDPSILKQMMEVGQSLALQMHQVLDEHREETTDMIAD
mmetsp:Transcript_25557/g.35262  ORF Transcript_25557/g.35262 Transcript_25557/m.35262 type:complete len:290 (+) Transcript_25557:239-1108(+)|eukprot:CAMPEP_0196588800 /NCGR_PEP_ID=MMETSP1081-20130531/61750_1 /TAXON_ID=36882 /ORGANISM="Pyramimonas amylifera, Strain CCMP720" /LENGTH=289 /DNA_ID=CAMNT_0041911417 /DNA_START=222 /DNA_END=1091 /DNA_ORIENTATION=+